MNRREFLKLMPLALLFVLMPKQVIRWFEGWRPDDAVSRYYKPRRITVPTFEIVATPTISIADIKARRFDAVTRQSILQSSELSF